MAIQFPTRAERTGSHRTLRTSRSLARVHVPRPGPESAVRPRDRGVPRVPVLRRGTTSARRSSAWATPSQRPGTETLRACPDGGVDAVVEARFAEEPPSRHVLCALQILIAARPPRPGLSSRMVRRMGEIGREHGLDRLIAPVRPNLKHRYPLVPMERYITWRRDDGTHLDPWLRTHERLGAEIRQRRHRVDANSRHGRRVGGMDGDVVSGERLVRRPGCAGSGRDRSRAGRRSLRRAQRLDGHSLP